MTMDNETLLYIEDTNKRKLFYRFTPAALISNFVPLIVVLHDAGEAQGPNFEYKMWNVLTPIDNFGDDNKRSYWLGEKGDFFVKDLLQELIYQIAEEYECEDHIYLYGSGTGGYGAILHGILCKANAVYAHVPKVRLFHADRANKQFYNRIFADVDTKENDVSNFLNSRDSFPIFFLCDKERPVQSSEENSLEDDIAYFVQRCKEHNLKCRLDFCPNSKDDEDKILKEVLDMLERVASQA